MDGRANTLQRRRGNGYRQKQKRQKIGTAPQKNKIEGNKISVLHMGGRCVKHHSTQYLRVSNIFLYLCVTHKLITMDGLTIKNGRLINERPDGITGIQHAANIKRGRKNAKKVEQIAEGVAMADSIREMQSMLHKKKF